MSTYGTLLDVHTDVVGEPLTADAVATATTIAVVDATTFREEGGLVKIGLDVYTYTAIDTELNTITLASGLLRAVAADDLAEVYPTALVKRAFVDTGIGGDAEGVWATVPQTMVLTLPDGLRYEGQRETVLLTERGPGELVLADVNAAANVAASTVLPEGSVDTHLLQVGVTGNLVLDPDFTRNYWQPPRKFTIAGPDTVYTDSNFIRAVGDATLNITAPGQDQYDWSWWLTDIVPVDPGRAIRVKALARRDAASIGSMSGTKLQARVRVVFYKADHVTNFSIEAQFAALDLAGDMVVDTWTEVEVIVNALEGYTHFQAGVQVTGQAAGFVDFIKPEVQVLWNRVQSTDYAPGIQGWALDTDQAQVENINVLLEMGANSISTQTLDLGGADLQTEILDPLGQGAIAYDNSGTGGSVHTATTSGVTELLTHVFVFGPVRVNRLYRVSVRALAQGTVALDSYDARLRYTTNGTTPTTASPVMPGGIHRFNIPSVVATALNIWSVVVFGSDFATVKVALTLLRVSGTGGAFIYGTADDRRMDWVVEDLGLYANAVAAGTLAQKSYSTGAAAQADPPSTYVTSWLANWSRSYDATLATMAGDPVALYQGYYSSAQGNTRSLFGFDYAAIQTALTGATIIKATLTYRVQHVWRQYISTLYIGSHNYTTKPSTWNGANVNEQRWSFATQIEGSTYTQDITAVAAEFAAGTTRGLAFGPTLTNTPQNWGYMYGGTTDANRPKLTITYKK